MSGNLFWGIMKNNISKRVILDSDYDLDHIFSRLLNTSKHIHNMDNFKSTLSEIFDNLERSFIQNSSTVYFLDDAYMLLKTGKHLKFYGEIDDENINSISSKSGYILNLDNGLVEFYESFPSKIGYYNFPFDVFVRLQ